MLPSSLVLVSVFGALAAASCASASMADSTRPAGTHGPEVESVVAAVEDMFEAMRGHDASALRASLMKGAIIVHVGEKPGEGVRHELVSDTDFIASLSSADHVVDERFTEAPAVRVQGSIATLWGPYEVFVGGERHHCGVDAVQLARLDGTWRVTAITYTARACE